MTDQERDRVAKELCSYIDCLPSKDFQTFPCEADYVSCNGKLADWHLKEVEKAEARGMKKATNRIGCCGDFDTVREEIKILFMEANKTLEAEGEEKK